MANSASFRLESTRVTEVITNEELNEYEKLDQYVKKRIENEHYVSILSDNPQDNKTVVSGDTLTCFILNSNTLQRSDFTIEFRFLTSDNSLKILASNDNVLVAKSSDTWRGTYVVTEDDIDSENGKIEARVTISISDGKFDEVHSAMISTIQSSWETHPSSS